MSHMQQTNLRFWVVQIMSLATLVLFLSLATWQLGRGNIKSDIEKASDQNSSDTVDVHLPLENLHSWRYKHIQVQGVYDSEKQFLLDNQVRDRTVGYNVLTPLYIKAQKQWVLVDRGWIPQSSTRDELPDVGINLDKDILVTGSIYVPYDEAYSLGGIADGEDLGWPRRIQFVDYTLLSERLGVTLQPFTLRLNSIEKHGYRRDWSEYNLSAHKHYGYAFQWFAMAFAVIVLWWLYSIKPLLNKT